MLFRSVAQLVAYAGRAIDKSEPKYKFPAGFHKSQVLYNLHRVPEDCRHLVLVEGFFDCLAVWRFNRLDVGALMGCSMSERQEELLVSRFDQVSVMMDGDEAGRKAAEEIALRLARKVFVRIIELSNGKQPDGLSKEEVLSILK